MCVCVCEGQGVCEGQAGNLAWARERVGQDRVGLGFRP